MKRLARVLLAIIFAATLLPYASGMVALVYPPHEDPATAESALDASTFLTYYADILSLASSRDYENASRLIEQLKYVSVPEDLKYVIDRYNNLTLELTRVSDNLDTLLNETSALLDQHRLDEASPILEEAGTLVTKADILLRDIEEATGTLSERLGVFAAPTESKVRDAYDRLQGILKRLRELWEEYSRLLTSMKEASQTQREELKPTELSLRLNTTRIFVGGFVNASGTLRSNGEDMLNRTVVILLDEEPAATAITGSNGSYQVLVEMPYSYVQTMAIKALYTPIGDDVDVYLASLSPPISLDVVFYETKLETEAPDEAHPGLPITVTGKVTSENGVPLSERTVKMLSNGDLLAEAETSIQGLFEIQATLSPQTPLGEWTLTTVVEPDGVYAGVSQDRTLNIVKIPSQIGIHVPSLIILPAKMYVEGNASSALGPLQDATVTLQVGGKLTTVKTSENGEFNATIDMPLSLIFSGFQELTVNVEPAEPWHAPTQAEASIFVVNPTNIGFISAAFASMGAVLYTRLSGAKRREKAAKVREAAPPPSEKSSPTIFPSKAEVKFEGVNGRILRAYAKTLKIVERATAASMKPQMTLREFLWEAKPKLKSASESFADLTFLAERTLYSPYVLTENEAAEVEDLALNVIELLKVEPA
jgi:hypothetical protein